MQGINIDQAMLNKAIQALKTTPPELIAAPFIKKYHYEKYEVFVKTLLKSLHLFLNQNSNNFQNNSITSIEHDEKYQEKE